MQAIRCEACGNTDLIKQDGYYICQYCGCKYTEEQAKRMTVEGTVKIDNSEFIEKCLANARRAKQKEDWEETEKYYNLVEQNDPSNIEAIFYSAYGKAKASLMDGDLYKRRAAFKVLQNCISILDDNFDIKKSEENKKIISQISTDILAFADSEFVYNYTTNDFGITTWSDKDNTTSFFLNLSKEFINTLLEIEKKFSKCDEYKTTYLYELMLKHSKFVLEHSSSKQEKDAMKKTIQSIHDKWNTTDRKHSIHCDDEYLKNNSKKKLSLQTKISIVAVTILLVFFVILLILDSYHMLF